MIIKRMTATFGCLEGARLELDPGLNVICAPNESGKSTWCAFLRAMFYGIPTRERDTKDSLAEKNRFRPWSGLPMEGELELVWRGQSITLRRFAKGASPFGGFEAVYTGTGQPVPGLDGQTCGEQLLGVGREVWERSAFLGQSPTLAIDGAPELERRISALASSGQEDVSFSQTKDTLKKWLNARRHNKTGTIPALERELAGLDDTLLRMRSANTRIAQAQAQRLALEERRAELERELAAHRALEQQSLNERYAQALEQERTLRGALDRLEREQTRFSHLPSRAALLDAQAKAQQLAARREELSRARDEAEQAAQAAAQAEERARDERFAGLDGDQAEAQAQTDRDRTQTLSRRAEATRRILFLPFLLLLLGCIPLLFFSRLPLPAAVGVPSACAALSVLLYFLLRRRAAALTGEQAAILDRYAADVPDAICQAARDYRRRQEDAAYARRDAQRLSDACAERQRRLDGDQSSLTDFARSFAPGAGDLFSCTDAVTRALELSDRLDSARAQLRTASQRCDDLRLHGAREELLPAPPAPPARSRQETEQALARLASDLAAADSRQDMAKGELASLGDPAELESRREQTERQLARRRQEYDAISAALDALEGANSVLQQRFAPELNLRAGQIISRLTGGRYADVSLDREFSANATPTGGILPRSALSLSRGTADQLYLAVRLAVCQLCLPEDDPSPLVLDDALLTFDDARLRLALAYLAETGRQILLFSCQTRESETGLGSVLHLNL